MFAPALGLSAEENIISLLSSNSLFVSIHVINYVYSRSSAHKFVLCILLGVYTRTHFHNYDISRQKCPPTHHSESPLVRDDFPVSFFGLGCELSPLRLQLSTPLLFLLHHRLVVHGQCAVALLNVSEGVSEDCNLSGHHSASMYSISLMN